MIYRFSKFIFSVFVIFFAFQLTDGQILKPKAAKLLSEVQENEKNLSECRPTGRRISHFCYDFCPTSLVLPTYPFEARRLRIAGAVKIEVIVNETGNVIYAKILEGKTLLSQSARQAAFRSKFTPQKNCNGKLIKFRGTIVYNFL